MFSTLVRPACLFLLTVLALTTPAIAQVSSGFGSISGLVQDASGAGVSHSKITVTNVNTGVSRSAQADESGRYTVLSLPIGEYEVRAEASGFRPVVRNGIILVIGRTALVDFNLPVGQLTEVVTVTESAPLIESANATIGQVIQNAQVVALPLNGRSYTQLAALVPGVVFGGVSVGTSTQNSSIATTGSFSISGSRPEGNQFSLNGINVTNDFTGGTFAYPPIDSIQEFKIVQNSYGAEFGGRTGQVIVTSKGGTNEFHGSAYEFFRNDHLDANNFFNNLAGINKRPLKQNQFGASLGGPVLLPHYYSGKNRTFFFVNYEGARIRSGTTSTTTVPTAAMRQGDFSGTALMIKDPLTGNPFPNNRIPDTRISPIALNVMRAALYPLPNVSGSTNNYTISPSAST
ncbi:MAG TPA: carboxypeptidase-like regulatory domain-containing protein, partial [Bryobacteraceae bacterium]|nr:carboxypeptidase-like regulatory domain-containing protein [Bryobacteraceae bacterium]